MPSMLFFKKKNDSGQRLFCNFHSALLLLLMSVLLGACAGTREQIAPGRNDLADVNLRGPVRSMFVETMPGTGEEGASWGAREFRVFDRDGNLLHLVEFGGTVDDTTGVTQHYYDSLGLRTRTVSGTWVGRNRWQWNREEFTYDSSGTLLWSARYFDTSRGSPYIAFCHSRSVEEEKNCLEYWQNVRTLKVLYMNDNGLALGEQWLQKGESQGVIRYLKDTVECDDHDCLRLRLPPENIDSSARRYVANLYNDTGTLVEQWSYAQSSAAGSRYSDAQLREVKRFDDAGRLSSWTFWGPGPGDPVIRNRFRYDERGNLQEKSREHYLTRAAYRDDDEEDSGIEERFLYTSLDRFGNWQRAESFAGNRKEPGGVIRRTFTYYPE